ncbi:MerR family transcriptional regulator [Pseudoalteromonas luteoviolacea]|uniref:MerR family transcriptional regulator n=1 Tax=Pseudoalteromonas luteoviolacea TaxID=43657 RepID=UPI001B39E29B|nr:MerR family transcriptional regulator [Pseudoalteromonas luteoviolacea]MBQ4880413.1 MerR family transcriptional regulator [Pseudoalteromonas luteoviolacea]MBQ4909474.1 MerR family transcriptional regulator [Pseudoalteromonas luteoviolacea]
MYKISELAKRVGLSRTALLYYEKQQLITGKRQSNGYRVYLERDVQRVRLIQKLLAGGLTIKECKACLDSKIDPQLLRQRLSVLDEEIKQKQQARDLLSAMLGDAPQHAWHEELNAIAPDAHLNWLIQQGFNEKEALRLKWLSKDMNEHEKYMADFMKVFSPLVRWAPGSEEDTLKALSFVPFSPQLIADIGCGKGYATQLLVAHTKANIIAVDNEQSALDALTDSFTQQGLSHRLQTECASMTELSFNKQNIDLIWSEGSAYIMGVQNALKQWSAILNSDGVLVFSDMVWHTAKPSAQPQDFWTKEYPDMQSVESRLAQISTLGYKVLAHFPQSAQAWQNYYGPLHERVIELKDTMVDSTALQDIQKEVDICTEYANEFGYHMFILQKI